MTFMASDIQPGWTVCASDGEELGTVSGVDGTDLRIRKGGLLGGELQVPLTAVAEVETGRVELSVTKQEASASS